MRIKRLSLLAVILCLSILSTTATRVSAQTIFPGVSKGEVFDYSYSLIWASTNPSATPPSDLVEYNNTQQIQFKITGVSGSTLNVDFIRHFKNGSQTIQSGTINLENGQTTVPYGFLIIGSNLAKNQQVYPNGGHVVITDTVTRSYSTGQRETNLISGGDATSKTSTYYDKVKGIAVEYSYEIDSFSNSYSVVSTERMVNTNSDVWATSTPSQTSTPTNPSTASSTPKQTSTPTSTSATEDHTVTVSPTSTETDLNTSNVLVIVGIVGALIVVLAVALILLKKRRLKKEKGTPQEDFDLSGWNMK